MIRIELHNESIIHYYPGDEVDESQYAENIEHAGQHREFVYIGNRGGVLHYDGELVGISKTIKVRGVRIRKVEVIKTKLADSRP